MTSGITGEKRDIIGQLAERFIRGNGIEIGDAPCGFPVPPGVCLRRVDDSSLAMADGETGAGDKTLANLDFCIAGNTSGDAGDPLTLLHRYLQVLRTGGILFMLVPYTPDSAVQLSALKRALVSHERGFFVNVTDSGTRSRKKGEILTLEGKIQWQGDYPIKGSRAYVFVLERFDYTGQIEDLLQKKVASPKNLPCPADVIIPVYNAYEDLLRCLYSVMTNYENERIILIDDNSTDPRIGSLFSLLEQYQSSSFIVIRQKKNLVLQQRSTGGCTIPGMMSSS